MHDAVPVVSYRDIVALRPARNPVIADEPYAYLVEREYSAAGTLVDVATLFLTNRECPFRCLMCDLWKNTLTERVPRDSIPRQIEFALARLPPAQQIKLYNSGNFFDAQAIPPDDLPSIAHLVQGFERVIVENHPRLCTNRCTAFQKQLAGELEIALGLETIHPRVLPALNKQMTLDDFARAVEFLLRHEVHVRAFILLKPPYLSEAEGVEWALRSLEYAFELGVECCSVIPTRAGNGAMDLLQSQGHFSPPTLNAMEMVLREGLKLRKGRVFMDLWDVDRLQRCRVCGPTRRDSIEQMNYLQRPKSAVECTYCGEED